MGNNTVKGFRIDNSTLEGLKTESREKQITLNNHVNNILARHNEVYSNFQDLRYVWLSPEFVKTCVNSVNKKDINKLGRICTDDLKKQIMCRHGKITLESTLETIEKNCISHGIPFKITKSEDGDTRYTMVHSLGNKWSMIQKHTIEDIMNSINHPVKEFELNDNHLSFSMA
jgi:hypothetical protein